MPWSMGATLGSGCLTYVRPLSTGLSIVAFGFSAWEGASPLGWCNKHLSPPSTLPNHLSQETNMPLLDALAIVLLLTGGITAALLLAYAVFTIILWTLGRDPHD